VRLQTWFPFEVQIGLNGREWLARRLDQEGMPYRRSDNKFLWVEDWGQAPQWLDEQQRTAWVEEFDALVRQVHPLHPGHLGRLRVAYNGTVHQSELATDVAFVTRAALERW
jgi:ribosome-binding ATPase